MHDLFAVRQRKRLVGLKRSNIKFWSTFAVVSFLIVIAGIFSLGILFAWYAKDLPRPDKVARVEGLSTVVLDRNGQKLYDIYENENRIPAKWEDVPDDLKHATLAIEDKDFYKHAGLSEMGIARAVVNIFIFHNFQGGSTLTQQLVKNVLLTNERTVPRKIKEAILALQIERKYTKDEILLMYLNETPYGGPAVGIEAASQEYFEKPARELTILESAIIAGLGQAPSRYSPFIGEPNAYIDRTIQVLRRMREDGYITKDKEEELKSQLPGFTFASGMTNLRAPHFVAYVREQLVDTFGSKLVEGGGLTVTTTLDWNLQEEAQKIVSEEVEKAKKLKVSNGAAVVIDPGTGEVLAMVGSKDYSASESGGFKFNVATQGLRQPGSSIKPITYAAALRKGYTASTLLMDVETKYPSGDPAKPEYNPKNYTGKYTGPVQLRTGLGNSINTVAVKVSALVGIRDILRLAYDMGLVTLEATDENERRFGLSLTLGGGEVTLLDLTSAFGVFATGGMRTPPVSILKVAGPKGNVLFEYKPQTPRRVLEEEVSYLISNILSDNDARKDVFGTKSQLVIPGKTTAVKTGTTDDKRDNWAIGYSPDIVVGTWVGNNDNSPMNPTLASGITGAAPIWNRIIRLALQEKPDKPFVRPDTIVEMDIDAYGGGLSVSGTPSRKEVFIKGTEPTGPAAIYEQVKLSKRDNNKLANQVEIDLGQYDTKSFVVFKENDPVSSDGKNRWQVGIDEWIKTQGDSKFHPPTETQSSTDEVALNVKNPSDMDRINNNVVEIKAKASSTSPIQKIEVFVDGILVRDTNKDEIDDTITLADGSYIIKVQATNEKGAEGHRELRVGINEDYQE